MLKRKEQECQVEREEQREEHDRRPQGKKQAAESKEEPSPEVQREHLRERIAISAIIRSDNIKSRCEDDAKGDPEATVRGQGSSTEGIADGHLPHAGEELDETAVAVGESDDEVGSGDVVGADVDEGEDEGGEGEGTETEGSWVGDLLLLGDRGVDTGVEL